MVKPTLHADSLFSGLPAELLRGLFDKAPIVSLNADQTVFLDGDPGDGCYRVEDGLLKVSVVASGGGERILAIHGPGSLVGELSMIDGAPRSASVFALRPSKLSFISRTDFESLSRVKPVVYKRLMPHMVKICCG